MISRCPHPTVISSAQNFLCLFTLPVTCHECPSTCVLDPISLLPLLGHCSISLIPSPSFPGPKHLILFSSWKKKSLQWPLRFSSPCRLSKRVFYSRCPWHWPRPCISLLPCGPALVPRCSLEGCCATQQNEDEIWIQKTWAQFLDQLFTTWTSLSSSHFLWISNELIDKEDPCHTHTKKHCTGC